MWLEELSRKQANRKSMTALGEKKAAASAENNSATGNISSGSTKPAIPSKPTAADTSRKSLSSTSNIIRRPNSFGEKSASSHSINKSVDSSSASNTALFGNKSASSTEVGNNDHSNNRPKTVGNKPDVSSLRKMSGGSGGERIRKDSTHGTENISPKRSADEKSHSRSKDSPRSNKDSVTGHHRSSNKESGPLHRSSSKESDYRSNKKLERKSSDTSKGGSDTATSSKPSVHSNNLGKPGNWAFTAPERPSDLGKLLSSTASSVNNSRQDLTSRSSGHDLTSSTRSDTSVKPENISLASPTKTSNSIPFKSLNTHEEEGGFVVIEAANEALASVWASKELEGQQPRPPAREKHLHSHSSQQSANSDNNKALERRVEELERLLTKLEVTFKADLATVSGQLEASYKADMAVLTSQLEAERQRRIELEAEVAKLGRIVQKS
eukprot:TRINITY_DN16429_c0_g1_i2.p1 TRINITY_DN16429_c0_g1~~TRINITY_DN16429_c0_g1_i2.p1  ORF type:complete len:439 (-),score=89.85 TRINITY_DN16429_c0_g1_i2:89-1405(-)